MKFNDQVVYQIYPKSFQDSNGDGIGDIQGIISRLDYLQDLGVNYIWLSPVNKSPQHDNGYDIADYYQIDPMFGTLEDYKQLIKEVKSRNMKLMLDLVLNHTSSEHEWFKKALTGDEYYQDFYIWRDEPNELETFFSKSAWTYSEEVGKYYFHLFDTHQPDLNWENENVRQEIYKMVNFWIDLGVEGFRLDVIDLIGKEPDKLITAKGPKFYTYLKELHDNTFKDELLTVGECWQASTEEARLMCTDGLTQVFHFEHLTTTNINGNKWDQKKLDLNELAAVILKWQNEYDLSQNWVMNNHDMPRLSSLWIDGVEDKYRYEGATMLATIFGLLKGTQYIYQGEEIGMINTTKDTISEYNDVESLNVYEKMIKEGLSNDEAMRKIKLISRDNPRVPFNWTNEDDRGFGSSEPWLAFNTNRYSLENDLLNEKSIYRYYQQLIKFKQENFDKYIDCQIDAIDVNDQVLTIKKGQLEIVANFEAKSKAYSKNKENRIMSNYQLSSNLEPYEVFVRILN